MLLDVFIELYSPIDKTLISREPQFEEPEHLAPFDRFASISSGKNSEFFSRSSVLFDFRSLSLPCFFILYFILFFLFKFMVFDFVL